MFDVGDKVVYPHHGAGTVVSKDVKLVLGEEREYLTIKILHNEMTVNVPVDNAEKVGLRGVIDQEMVDVVVKVLLGGSTEMPKNWNRRFKHNRDKMKTGDVLELAEVVRNLALRDHEKGLSTGTLTVISLWRIRMVRYSRSSPSTTLTSFFSTVPAP